MVDLVRPERDLCCSRILIIWFNTASTCSGGTFRSMTEGLLQLCGAVPDGGMSAEVAKGVPLWVTISVKHGEYGLSTDLQLNLVVDSIGF